MGSEGTTKSGREVGDIFADDLVTLDPPSEIDINTLGSYDSAWNNAPPLADRRLIFNKNAQQFSLFGILPSITNLVEDAAGPVKTQGLKPEGVTPENHLEKAAARIEQRQRELGRRLNTNESSAIIDAYRQLAGLSPRFYELDPNGAARPRTFGAENVNLRTVFENSIKDLGKKSNDLVGSFENLPEKAGGVVRSVTGTTQLVAIAAGLIAVTFLLKR